MLKKLGMVQIHALAGIQYLGESGLSGSCLTALRRLVAWLNRPNLARLISADGCHAFLFSFTDDGTIVVKDGFSSGYRGEGPSALAEALLLVQEAGWDIDEVEVSQEVMTRLARSGLTSPDVDAITTIRPIRPQRLYDYIHDAGRTNGAGSQVLQRLQPVIPLALLDPRLIPLARMLPEQPDKAILDGFRILEDRIRERTQLSDYGAKLFSAAFSGEKSCLTWQESDRPKQESARNIPASEQIGRAQLFTGAFQAYRNRRAHHKPEEDVIEALREFMVLNQLFLLEGEAIQRMESAEQT